MRNWEKTNMFTLNFAASFFFLKKFLILFDVDDIVIKF